MRARTLGYAAALLGAPLSCGDDESTNGGVPPADASAGTAGTGGAGATPALGTGSIGGANVGGASSGATGAASGRGGDAGGADTSLDGGALPDGAQSIRLVTGTVTASGVPVPNARVTVFIEDLAFFREVRTASDGTYSIEAPLVGAALGVAAPDFEYEEIALFPSDTANRDFALEPETHPGRWTVVGDTSPEFLEGTGWGTLLYSGDMFFCHNANDPLVFDPVSTSRWFPDPNGVTQGCHLEVPLTSGDLMIAGGSTEGLPQQNVVDVTKAFRAGDGTWPVLDSLNEGRWYPGGVRLPDERILLVGGEGQPDGYGRVNTCEIYEATTNTWTPTGSFDLPTEMPPTIVLLNGQILKTWRYPEFYDAVAGSWSEAPAMQQARLGAPLGDHGDHEIIYLRDGRLMAVGIDPDGSVQNPSMVEFYDVDGEAWSVGPSPAHLRRAPEAIQLPDGQVLVFGGTYTGTNPSALVLKNAGTVADCTNVADLFDPATDTWRAAAPLGRWIHYHAVTLLGPDGRVLSTGGAGTGTSRTFGDDPSIEAYEPSYLFRGVRPRIDGISTTDLSPGETFTLDVSRTNAVTEIVMIGARATTHWIDTGPQRFLAPEFQQTGAQVSVAVPNSAVTAVPGWYLVFAMVDDIPSEGVLVRVTAAASPAPIASLPNVSIEASAGTVAEGGEVTLTIRRNAVTTVAALNVALAVDGTAMEGFDYEPLPRLVTIPAGASDITLPLRVRGDSISEGNEAVRIEIATRAHYSGAASSTEVTITGD